jgi:hypothetical protein
VTSEGRTAASHTVVAFFAAALVGVVSVSIVEAGSGGIFVVIGSKANDGSVVGDVLRVFRDGPFVAIEFVVVFAVHTRVAVRGHTAVPLAVDGALLA